MLNSLNSEHRGAWTLVPFLYAVATRHASARDFTYLVASSWLPGIWLVHRLGGLALAEAALTFAAGFLAMIALYEIGYFVNDAWDAGRSETARRRLRFGYDRGYVAAFLGIRLAAWAAIGAGFGWIAEPVWLAAHAALALVFAEHNLVRRPAFRAASFFQLACLRFVIPVLGAVPGEALFLLLFAAVVFYAYLRFLSYLESKEHLSMADRRRRDFALVQTLMLAPLAALGAFASGEAVLLELWGYFAAVYGLYALIGRV